MKKDIDVKGVSALYSEDDFEKKFKFFFESFEGNYTKEDFCDDVDIDVEPICQEELEEIVKSKLKAKKK